MQNAERRLLNAKEAGLYLGISARTAKEKAAHGELPSLLVGNKRMFPKDRLDAWIDEQMTKQAPQSKSSLRHDVDAWLTGRKEASR